MEMICVWEQSKFCNTRNNICMLFILVYEVKIFRKLMLVQWKGNIDHFRSYFATQPYDLKIEKGDERFVVFTIFDLKVYLQGFPVYYMICNL